MGRKNMRRNVSINRVSSLISFLARYTRNRDGNIAMMFAISIFALIACIAVAIEVNRMISLRIELQDIADSAALAAAIEESNPDSDENPISTAQKLIESLSVDLPNSVELATPDIEINKTDKETIVELSANLDMIFGTIFGFENRNISVESRAVYGHSGVEPTSLVFVLDISGSMNANMGANNRIGVLQDTVEDFFVDIQSNNNHANLLSDIRTGLRSYNMQVQTSESTDIQPGWGHVLDKVETFSLDSGTLPHEAMEQAVAMLKNDRMYNNHTLVREVIIYMTDGEVDDHLITSGKNSTQRTQEACDDAKASDMEIFAIGMDAPTQAKALLQYCATSGVHPVSGQPYYYNTTLPAEFEMALGAAVPGISKAEIRLK